MPIIKTSFPLSTPGHAFYVPPHLHFTLSARYTFGSLRSHKQMTYRLTHTDMNYFYRSPEGRNHTLCISSPNRDDNNDFFITLDEVSVICRAVTCQVITINKPVRHSNHDPITSLLNHWMGVKGGAGERCTDSTPKTIKSSVI